MDTTALHRLSYGVYVVASVKDGKFNGQIANSVMQITSEPPTLAVSINRNNLTHEYITHSKVFTVSILCQSASLPFIGSFGFKSGRDTDKTRDVNFKVGETGAPIFLDHTNACLEAEVMQHLDVGTHTIFVGRIVAAEVLTDDPCMTYEYYHQVKRGTTPKSAPSYIAKQ